MRTGPIAAALLMSSVIAISKTAGADSMDPALESPCHPAPKARLSQAGDCRLDRVTPSDVSLHHLPPICYPVSSSADSTDRVNAQITHTSSAMMRIAQNG